MKPFRMTTLSLFAALAWGCADDFAPVSRVDELRLLAVRAEPPSAAPGDEVQLEALFHDPEQRSLSWGWGRCDASASTAAVDCLRALDVDSLQIATDERSHRLRVPLDLLDDLDQSARSTVLGVAVVLCPGSIESGDTDGIPVRCVDARGRALSLDEMEIGMKRVFVQRGARTRNPTLRALTWDGEPWMDDEIERVDACAGDALDDCAAGDEHVLEVDAPDAAEAYEDRAGATVREQVIVQYYATGGMFEHDLRVLGSPRTHWAARPEDAGQTLTLWTVLRDDRGGVSWQTRRVEVR